MNTPDKSLSASDFWIPDYLVVLSDWSRFEGMEMTTIPGIQKFHMDSTG